MPSTAASTTGSKRAPKTTGTRGNKPRAMPADAVIAQLPSMLAPELATLVSAAPETGDWQWEIKFDGYRMLVRIENGMARLFSRNGKEWSAKVPHLAKALGKLPVNDGWLDSEIVMPNDNGLPDFQSLQNAFEEGRTGEIVIYLFDAPYLNGHDLRRVPLIERRQLLETVLKGAKPPIFFSQSFDAGGHDLLKTACEMRLEGLIGKRASSIYQSRRSDDWIKLKCLQRQEFLIGGYTDSKRPDRLVFGALLLGVHEDDGRLRYAGRVGTGFSETSLRELMKQIKPLEQKAKPFDIFVSDKPTRDVHWINPRLVCEVAFSEWTRDGHIRHPSFQGLRTDKPPKGIATERAKKPPALKRKRNQA